MIHEKIYIGIIVLLLIILILFVILTQEERKDLIKISQCSKPKGQYAVDAGFSSSNTINTCGANSNSVCSFTASSLKNAFTICDSNAEKCSRFVYNEQTKTMSFIDDKPAMLQNTNTSIYIRQGGIESS